MGQDAMMARAFVDRGPSRKARYRYSTDLIEVVRLGFMEALELWVNLANESGDSETLSCGKVSSEPRTSTQV